MDRGEPRPPGRGRGRDQRHGLLRGQRPGHHGRPARDHVRADRRGAVAGGPALRDVRRDRRQPGQRARPDHRGAQGPRRPSPHPGLLRRRGGPDARQSARRWRRSRSTTRPTGRRSPCRALVGETGWTTLERKGARPTLDVNGMWSGFQGDGAKTIIPAHAHAKISTRLVANQDPRRVFEALRDYVAEVASPGVTVTTTFIHGGEPSLTPTDHPATQAAARALRAVHGVDPGVHPRGRFDPGHGRVRPHPGAARRAARVLPALLQRPRAQRVAGPGELRAAGRASSSGSGTSWRACPGSAVRRSVRPRWPATSAAFALPTGTFGRVAGVRAGPYRARSRC